MPPILPNRPARTLFSFALGFVLGASTMASPALGLSLAVLAACYLVIWGPRNG